MLSSQLLFALILIDIIEPTKELLWSLRQVQSQLDEFVSRHLVPDIEC